MYISGLPDLWSHISTHEQVSVESSRVTYVLEGPRGYDDANIKIIFDTANSGANPLIPKGWSETNIEYQNWTNSTDAAQNDGIARIEVSYASQVGGDPVVGLIERTWEREYNEQDVSPAFAPSFYTGLVSIVGGPEWITALQRAAIVYRDKVRAWVDGGMVGNQPASSADYPGKSKPAAADETLSQDLYEILYSEPETSYTLWTPILRKSEVVTRTTTLAIADTNNARMLTWDKLLADEPSLVDAGIVKTTELQALYWLKSPPRVMRTTGQRIQLAQSYEGFVDFNEKLWGAPIST